MSISFFQLVNLFKVLLTGIIAAVTFIPLLIWLAKRFDLVDIPGSADHKRHTQPTPLAGGLVIILCCGLLISLFGLWGRPIFTIFAGALIVFIFGLWDDIKSLTVLQKMAGQFLASILLFISGISVQFLEGLSIGFLNPAVLRVLNFVITMVWLIGITNSINLIDSMDGLAVGVSGIAFAFFMGMALAANQNELALFSAIFLGICIGLFLFNSAPARLFLGDSGAQTLGFILAAVAILYVPEKLPQGSSWFVPIMVLGVPIFDTVLVIVSRLRRKTSIFQADFTHTYHRLVHLGLDPNRAVLIIHAAALVLNLLAFIALTLAPLPASLIFGLSLLIGTAFLVFFEYKRSEAVET